MNADCFWLNATWSAYCYGMWLADKGGDIGVPFSFMDRSLISCSHTALCLNLLNHKPLFVCWRWLSSYCLYAGGDCQHNGMFKYTTKGAKWCNKRWSQSSPDILLLYMNSDCMVQPLFGAVTVWCSPCLCLCYHFHVCLGLLFHRLHSSWLNKYNVANCDAPPPGPVVNSIIKSGGHVVQ